MRSLTPSIGRSAALLASILVVGTATAADVAPPDPALTVISPTMHSSPQKPFRTHETVADEVVLPDPVVTGMGQAIGADALDGFRGGDVVDNNVIIDGNVTGNTADRIVSGSNTIQDGAFANANGISTVIQNSGSNVLIQNGMVVTVQFTDPGL